MNWAQNNPSTSTPNRRSSRDDEGDDFGAWSGEAISMAATFVREVAEGFYLDTYSSDV